MRVGQGDDHGIIPDFDVGRLVARNLDGRRFGRALPYFGAAWSQGPYGIGAPSATHGLGT